VTVEDTAEVVPNGHTVADTLKKTDAETSVSPGTSAPSSSEKVIENGDVNRRHAVLPVNEGPDTVRQNGAVTTETLTSEKTAENESLNRRHEFVQSVETDLVIAETVRRNAAVTTETRNYPSTSEKKAENETVNRHPVFVPGVETDTLIAETVRQNGTVDMETRKPDPWSMRRERETQIRSLLIDDDADDDDITAVENSEVSEDRSSSGAQVFATSRPHAWQNDLAKNQHKATEESTLDRQVCCLHVFLWLIFHQN